MKQKDKLSLLGVIDSFYELEAQLLIIQTFLDNLADDDENHQRELYVLISTANQLAKGLKAQKGKLTKIQARYRNKAEHF